MTKKPFVRISRGNQWFGRLRLLDVYINGASVGTVKSGSSSDFTVSPGRVAIYVKMDWLRSAVITYEMDAEKNAFVSLDVGLPEGGPSYMGLNLGQAFLSIFGAGEFFQLKPAGSFDFQVS